MSNMNLFSDAFKFVLDNLPHSPFSGFIQSLNNPYFKQVMGWLNYFIPVNEIIVVYSSYLTCVAVYYIWSILLRFINAIK